MGREIDQYGNERFEYDNQRTHEQNEDDKQLYERRKLYRSRNDDSALFIIIIIIIGGFLAFSINVAWDSHNASSRNKYLQDIIGKEIVVWREPNDNKSQSNIAAIIEKDLRKGSIDFLLELPGEKQNGYRYLILDTPQYREYLKFPNHLTNGGWVLISDLSFLKTKIGEN